MNKRWIYYRDMNDCMLLDGVSDKEYNEIKKILFKDMLKSLWSDFKLFFRLMRKGKT